MKEDDHWASGFFPRIDRSAYRLHLEVGCAVIASLQ